jgi:hypothetical protein
MASRANNPDRNREEAVMAAIALNASHQAGHIGQPAAAPAPFQPLDSGIVNEAIPAFFIGRNSEGFWVARDVGGRTGGIFLLESSALSFARSNSRPAGCATIYPSERFELDLENRGNPLVARLGWGLRLAQRLRQRATALIGNTAGAVKAGGKKVL